MVDLRHTVAVAVVEGTRLKPRALLKEILPQFGLGAEQLPTSELLKILQVFATRKARAGQAPVIFLENPERMYPKTLGVLMLLADLKYRGQYVLRIIFSGTSRTQRLLRLPALDPLARRLAGNCVLRPFTLNESIAYLHARLTAAGVRQPDLLLPVHVCGKLHQLSGGVPGMLNKLAMAVLERDQRKLEHLVSSKHKEQQQRPAVAAVPEPRSLVREGPPRLVVTKDGFPIGAIDVTEKKLLIGRSKLADIVIENRFIGKFHALLVSHEDGLLLIDLNTKNGTFVNSVRASTTFLRSNDVVSLCDHRLKVFNAPLPVSDSELPGKLADTARMRNLSDLRRERARAEMFRRNLQRRR